MSTVRWRLADFLDERGISTYALIQAIGSTRMNTIYRLTRRGQEPSRVDLHTLATVLDGLTKLTGQPVGVADVLEYLSSAEAVGGREANVPTD